MLELYAYKVTFMKSIVVNRIRQTQPLAKVDVLYHPHRTVDVFYHTPQPKKIATQKNFLINSFC